MLAPIPLEVLIDTVTHSPLTQNPRGDEFGPDATISRVCVQSNNKRTYRDGSAIIIAGAMMFWDVVNSDDATFYVGDKITYTDKATSEPVTRYITDILSAQTNEGLHHIELTLV